MAQIIFTIEIDEDAGTANQLAEYLEGQINYCLEGKGSVDFEVKTDHEAKTHFEEKLELLNDTCL